jgi:hypothetical protein
MRWRPSCESLLLAINALANDWDPALLTFLAGAAFLFSWALWLSRTHH